MCRATEQLGSWLNLLSKSIFSSDEANGVRLIKNWAFCQIYSLYVRLLTQTMTLMFSNWQSPCGTGNNTCG